MVSKTKYISISECEMCSSLPEERYTFDKYQGDSYEKFYGAKKDEEYDMKIMEKLEIVKDANGNYNDKHHLMRCPKCGTYYSYDSEYEYLVNGTGDETWLKRMTPTESKQNYSNEEYKARIRIALKDLKSKNAVAMHYAGKSLADYYLENNKPEKVAELIKNANGEARGGAILFLSMSPKYSKYDFAPLAEALGSAILKEEKQDCKEIMINLQKWRVRKMP